METQYRINEWGEDNMNYIKVAGLLPTNPNQETALVAGVLNQVITDGLSNSYMLRHAAQEYITTTACENFCDLIDLNYSEYLKLFTVVTKGASK